MARIKDRNLFELIRDYLLIYLPNQRLASEKTVVTYRRALNLFLDYLAERESVSRWNITFDMFTYESVNGFLEWMSKDQEMTPNTCNNRLSVIRAFVSYASACRPEYISLRDSLDALKSQKHDPYAGIDYMTEKAVKAILNTPDAKTRIGLRDQVFLILLYDTGARIQEIVGLRLCDIRLDKTPVVTLHGKGRKTRTVPLMADTVKHLKNYKQVFHPDTVWESEAFFFYARKGSSEPICDDTMRVRINKYAEEARMKCPEVPENVYPHLWRHTRAMHLIQHGMDLTTISEWLGHRSLETTQIYAHINTEQKRQAIEHALGNKMSAETPVERYTVTDEDVLRKLYGL